MYPLGNYIKISLPAAINESNFIVEREPLAKAAVVAISPDIKVPFTEKDTLCFYTGRHIIENGSVFINIEMVVGYFN